MFLLYDDFFILLILLVVMAKNQDNLQGNVLLNGGFLKYLQFNNIHEEHSKNSQILQVLLVNGKCA